MNSIYDLLWMFFLYAGVGWCCEVIFAALCTGEFVNRGFLNGPVCPIYGFGVVTVVTCLKPVENNIILLFIGSVILTTLLEFLTGLILEKLFHEKWWDYSEEHFNLKGYVCARASITWGLACLIVVEIVHPFVLKLISHLHNALGITLICIFSAAIIIDLIITAVHVRKLPKRMKVIDDIEKALGAVSKDLGGNLSRGAIDVKKQYEKLQKEHNIVHERILKAFPRLSQGKYKNAAAKLREWREKIK